MLHRAAIRDAAQSILLAAKTGAGNRITANGVWPTQSGKMPALLLYIFDDSKVGIAEAGTTPMFKTTLTLVIEARVEAADLADATAQLDALCEQIETALLTNVAFVALVEQISGVRTRIDDKPVGGVGQKHVFNAKIALEVKYTEEFHAVFPPLAAIDTKILGPDGRPITETLTTITPS